MTAFRGVYVPNAVPLTASGLVDEQELESYVAWLVDQGVSGLYPNGSTGEFTAFDAAERVTIARAVLKGAAGRVPVLAGASESTPAAVLKACRVYADLGCAAASVIPPWYFAQDQAAVMSFYEEVASASPLPVFLYNIPPLTTRLDVDTIARLAGHPNIVGIKDSSRNLPDFLTALEQVTSRPDHRPSFSWFTGTEEILAPVLLMGGSGGVTATAGLLPKTVVHLADLASAGRWAEAADLQRRLLPVIRALFSVPFPLGFREALALRGFTFGVSRHAYLHRATALDPGAFRERLARLLTPFAAYGDTL